MTPPRPDARGDGTVRGEARGLRLDVLLDRLDDVGDPTADRSAWQRWAVGAAVAVAAADLGLLLGLIGASLGPAALLGIPLLLVLIGAAWSRPLLAFAGVLACLPVGLQPVPGDLLGLQVVQVTVVVVTGLVVLRRTLLGRAPLGWHPVLGWGLAGLLAALVATADGIDPATSIKADANLAIGLLLAAVALAVVRDLRDARVPVRVLLLSGAVISALSLRNAGEISGALGGSVVNNRLTGIFQQPNELGAFAAMLVLTATGFLLGTSRGDRLDRLIGGPALLLGLAALALSLSRGAWIGTALAGALLVVLLPRARRALVSVGLPVLLAGGALAAAVPDNPQVQVVTSRVGSLAEPADNPYDDRPAIYREAVREIREDPWTGVGPAGFPIASVRSASEARRVYADHAHNTLLTTAVEYGIGGLIALLGLTLTAARAVLRALPRLDGRDRALLAGLAAALVTNTGQGLVDFPLRNAVLFQLVWALLGLVLVGARQAAVGPAARVARPAGSART